ncbi:MAG TPA: glycosyltransferase [Steroidobacteraceae bacterium]|nr:glycosyltransferase [Steroidobacteraceae bacterium]
MEILRTCLVTEIFHPEDQGGQGRQAFALARRLRAHGAGVTVATRRNFSGSARRESFDGIHITRLPPTGLLKGKGWRAAPPTLWFLALLFMHLLRQRRSYDVLLVQGVKGVLIPTLLAALLLGKRCIVKVDAVAELEQELTPESLSQMKLRPGSTLVRLWSRLRDALLRRADATIAISAEIEAALTRRLGSATRIVRIPNGIELGHTGTHGNRRELRERLALPDGVVVIYTGRLARAKGLPMLLDVWTQIARERPDVHLVLVGSGDRSFDGCEPQLRDQVRRAGLQARVTFTGHVENVADYLRASDLFVLSSESEGFGLSLVEAMASGVPCVSTAVGIAPEVIRHGHSGWLVPVRDPRALSAALHDALDRRHALRAIGAAARRAVASRFDMDQVAGRYIDVMQEVRQSSGSVTSVGDVVAATSTLRRNASWLLACRVGADLLNFVLFVIVSRHFGPPGTGAYAYGFAIAGFVYSATTLGIDEYGIREYARLPADRRAALLADLLGTQSCIAVVAALVLGIYLMATAPDTAVLTTILALTTYQLCSAFAVTLFVPAIAEQRMARPSLIVLLGRGLGLAIAAPLILVWNAPLHIALLGVALSGLLTAVLAARSATGHGLRLRLHVAPAAVLANMRTLWSFAATEVMSQVFTRIGVIALALLVSERAAGVYAAGLKLVEVACLPLLFLGRAAYPGLSRAFGDPHQFGRISRHALWVGLVIAALSAVALALAAPPLLVPMLGPGFAGTEPIMMAMAALMLVQGAEIVLGRLLLSANLNVPRAAWTSVGAVTCVALTLPTVRAFGIEAAIAAVVVSFVLVDVLYAMSLQGVLRRRSFVAAEGSVDSQPGAQAP